MAEVTAVLRGNKVSQRMSSRHIELIRALSEKKRDREDQQRRQEQRLRRREQLLRERLLGRQLGRANSQPADPLDRLTSPRDSPSAASAAASARDGGGVASAAGEAPSGPPGEAAPPEEKRKWKAQCNADIERRQSEAIQQLLFSKNAQRIKTERDGLKRQWKAHKAKQYLVEKCQDSELKEYLESKKPRALPKLPCREGTSPSTAAGLGTAAEAPETPADEPPLLRTEGTSVNEDATTSVRQPLPHETVDRESEADDEVGAEDGFTETLSGTSADTKPLAKKDKRASLSGNAQASIDRFLDRAKQSQAAIRCFDLAEWKKRNRCAPDKRVFICCGGYPDFRDALLRRGWVQNEHKDSRHFDLKWGMAASIDHEHLLPNQAVNHFDRCRDLTTKSGLTINLRNSEWMTGVHADNYYPRAFDLYDPAERAEFVLDFKLTKAESLLRRFLEQVDAKAEMTFGQDVVRMALKICQRLVTDVDEIIDCPELCEQAGNVTRDEWVVLQKVDLDDVEKTLQGVPPQKSLDDMISKKSALDKRLTKKEEDENAAEEAAKNKKKRKKKKQEGEEEEIELCAPVSSFDSARGQHMVDQARGVLDEMESKNRQHTIAGGRNAWIIKPSGKSRGRGIKVVRELDEIFSATESDGYQWICQKYIEQPQLVHGYKFDIRQWVLVTDWNPLTVYVWRQPYVRFAGKHYDATCTDRSEYVHLVNNSIIKHMDGFEEKNNDLDTVGFMWFRQTYEKYMHEKYCKCEKHRTPFLKEAPYTCETFGVRWEDVAFTAKDESDSEDDGEEPAAAELARKGSSSPSRQLSKTVSPSASTPAGSSSSSTAPGSCSASPASPSSPSSSSTSDAVVTSAEPSGGSAAPKGVAAEARGARPQEKEQEEEACSCPECQDIWGKQLFPQMKDIIIQSLLCVVDQVAHRKNSFELYGYDFMVSEGADGPRPWLIEVNSSPACDYSTPVTCPLVKKVMEDTAKVMVDNKDDPSASTGEWEFIEHNYNKTVPQRTCNRMETFEVSGTRVRAPKGFKKKKRKKKGAAAASTDVEEAGAGDEGEAGESDLE